MDWANTEKSRAYDWAFRPIQKVLEPKPNGECKHENITLVEEQVRKELVALYQSGGRFANLVDFAALDSCGTSNFRRIGCDRALGTINDEQPRQIPATGRDVLAQATEQMIVAVLHQPIGLRLQKRVR